MDTLTNPLFDFYQSITWEGPTFFVALLLVVFIIFKQYNFIFMVFIALFFAAITHNLMIINGKTEEPVMSVSMLIYILAGGLIVLFTVKRFIKL